ncbi:neutral cholesterol ester hydrolase 1-like, partial [Silurus meridionalis]
IRMRLVLLFSVLLALVVSYFRVPALPGTVAEPCKLLLLDSVFRTMMWAAKLVQDLGLSNQMRVLNSMALWVELRAPRSSERVRVSDMTFSGVQARVFESMSPGPHRLKPAVVYFHGGGWALGSARMRSYDLLCRKMAEELDAVIISVDYRLVPDVYFPGQYEDAIRACRNILTHEVLERFFVDPSRLAVSGDSAGGNLAAAVAQELALDSSSSIRFKVQALIYPVLQALDFNTPSYQQNGDVPILYRSLMVRFWLEYLNGDQNLVHALLVNNHTVQNQEAATAKQKLDWTRLLAPKFTKHYKPVVPHQGSPQILQQLPSLLDTRAAPLLAKDEVLKLVPPAYIMTCEHDVLRDDGLMYAQRLEEAGVPVTTDHYEQGFHGIMMFGFFPACFSVGLQSQRNYIHWLQNNL